MTEPIYRKILVPVDGSKNSFKALDHAGQIASRFGSEIGVLYVFLPRVALPAYPDFNVGYIPETVYTDLEEFGKNVLENAVKLLPSSLVVHTRMEVGSPIEIIPQFAQNNGYDLIVIGSRGMGIIKGLVMGSVSNHVVHYAACPVLVVK